MINQTIKDFINSKDAVVWVRENKGSGAINTVLIHHNGDKEGINDLLFSSIGIYGDEAQQILSLTKEEVELYKKVARMKQIKKELETLEQEISTK